VLLDEHACVQIARHASGRRNGCGEGDGSRCWCEMVAATDKQGETDTPHRTQQCKLHAFEQQSCWNVCLLRWNRVSTTVCARRQTNNKPMTNTQTQQQQSAMMTACIIIITIPSQSCASVIILHKYLQKISGGQAFMCEQAHECLSPQSRAPPTHAAAYVLLPSSFLPSFLVFGSCSK